MAVLTISRQFGAGGITLGKMIADKLGYTFADTEIIQEIAKEANVSPQWVESFEKEAGSKLSRVISSMVSQKWIDRVLKDERGYLDEQIYLDYLVLIIAKMADEDDVVIIGRGSQYILNDHPDAFHILLVDEFENRVKFLVDRYQFSEKKATHIVTNEDKRRLNLYRKIGKKDYDNPGLYHLVLNMNRLDLPMAERLVCQLLGV
jgi:cytidylate kinase